jgi:hypothetical protein
MRTVTVVLSALRNMSSNGKTYKPTASLILPIHHHHHYHLHQGSLLISLASRRRFSHRLQFTLGGSHLELLICHHAPSRLIEPARCRSWSHNFHHRHRLICRDIVATSDKTDRNDASLDCHPQCGVRTLPGDSSEDVRQRSRVNMPDQHIERCSAGWCRHDLPNHNRPRRRISQ